MIHIPEDKIKEILTCYWVQVAYLFGSYVRQDISPLSDVDIAILFGEDIKPEGRFSNRFLLLQEIMTLLETTHLDLVVLNESAPALCFNVIYKGRILFCQDDSLRIKFESRVLQNYMDTEPLRRTYNQALFKNLSEGLLR